jgi:nucleoid-associated protein YgaU
MNHPLKSLIQMGIVPTVTFPADSRYYGFKTLSYTDANSQAVSYLERRIVPQPGASNYATVATHTVRNGDRLDLIAAKYLGDPLMFWLICDANGAIRPGRLLETPGEVLNITMPQGIPGGSNA